MGKCCFVCGKKLGLLSSKIKTIDHKYICAEDAIYYFGDASNKKNTFPYLAKFLGKLSSSEIINEIQNYKKEETAKEEQYQKQLETYRTVPLPEFAQKLNGINLKKYEYGYYAYNHDITWYEERSRTKRINYSGPMGTIHIAKGLNYRLGSIKTDMEHETYLKEIIKGSLLLTNKRIILNSGDGIKAYPFTRLLKAVPYNDGVVLYSESGKKVILEGFDDATPFNIFLDRLLTEDNVLPAK